MDLFSQAAGFCELSAWIVGYTPRTDIKSSKIHFKRGKPGTQGLSDEYTGKKMTWGHRKKTAFIRMTKEASS